MIASAHTSEIAGRPRRCRVSPPRVQASRLRPHRCPGPNHDGRHLPPPASGGHYRARAARSPWRLPPRQLPASRRSSLNRSARPLPPPGMPPARRRECAAPRSACVYSRRSVAPIAPRQRALPQHVCPTPAAPSFVPDLVPLMAFRLPCRPRLWQEKTNNLGERHDSLLGGHHQLWPIRPAASDACVVAVRISTCGPRKSSSWKIHAIPPLRLSHPNLTAISKFWSTT